MNKHILVVSQYYYPENFRINDITQEWLKRGYQVTVLTAIPNYPKGHFFKGYSLFRKRREVIDGVRVIRLAVFPRMNNNFSLLLNYLSFIVSGWFWCITTSLKADLVFNFEVSPMTQSLIAVWFAKRRRIPSFIYVQDLWPDNLEIVGGVHNSLIIKKINKMVDYIYTSATKILVTSDSFKKSILNRTISEEKVLVWFQYAEDFYRPMKVDFRKPMDLLNIIFTGNIGEAQGLEILPLVAHKLKKLNFDDKINFTIIGNGRNKNKIVNIVKEYHVENMFTFIDAIPPTEVPYYLSKADVAFVSFLNNELFEKTIPAKLQSYMACGMPILAVANGETRRIIEEARCGFVSNPKEIDNVVDNITQLYVLEENLLKEMSSRSIEYSKKYFDKKKLMDEIDKIFIGG